MESCWRESGSECSCFENAFSPAILHKDNKPFKDGFLGTPPQTLLCLGLCLCLGNVGACPGPLEADSRKQSREMARALPPFLL